VEGAGTVGLLHGLATMAAGMLHGLATMAGGDPCDSREVALVEPAATRGRQRWWSWR